MQEIDSIVFPFLRKLKKKYKVVILVGIISGVLAHGMALFNKYSIHDDVYSMFTVGATFSSGRYMLYELSHFIQKYTGGLFSTPLYNGILTLLQLLGVSILLISLLRIESKVLCALLSAFLIVFPAVAGLLGFMFTAPYYALAIFLTILGAYIICKKKRYYSVFLGALLIGNSIGIYQAYIPLFLSVFLIYGLKEWSMFYENPKKLLLTIPYYFLASIMSVIIYFITNLYELQRYRKALSSYAGIDKMGRMSGEELLTRIKKAYRYFLFPDHDLFPTIVYRLYQLIVVLAIVLSVVLIIRCFRKCRLSGIGVIFLTAMIPVGVNFSYIMVDTNVYGLGSLQLYGYVMVYVWFVFLLDNTILKSIHINRLLSVVCSFIMLITIFLYVRLDNVIYLRAEILKTRSLTYFTELITQIKSAPGYKDTLPVVFIKNGNIDDTTIKELSVWDYFNVRPYFSTEYNINYAWYGYIYYWLGFNAERVDSDPFEEMDIVKRMPTYPDDGSIRVIDNTIVVKLADKSSND